MLLEQHIAPRTRLPWHTLHQSTQFKVQHMHNNQCPSFASDAVTLKLVRNDAQEDFRESKTGLCGAPPPQTCTDYSKVDFETDLAKSVRNCHILISGAVNQVVHFT